MVTPPARINGSGLRDSMEWNGLECPTGNGLDKQAWKWNGMEWKEGQWKEGMEWREGIVPATLHTARNFASANATSMDWLFTIGSAFAEPQNPTRNSASPSHDHRILSQGAGDALQGYWE